MRPETHLKLNAASGKAASKASFQEIYGAIFETHFRKTASRVSSCRRKGGWYTTQGGVRVELFFHYAIKAIDDSLKAFRSEKSGFPKFCIGLDFVLVDEPVEHIWINPVLLRKRRSTD